MNPSQVLGLILPADVNLTTQKVYFFLNHCHKGFFTVPGFDKMIFINYTLSLLQGDQGISNPVSLSSVKISNI